jgi:hypothetical protein
MESQPRRSIHHLTWMPVHPPVNHQLQPLRLSLSIHTLLSHFTNHHPPTPIQHSQHPKLTPPRPGPVNPPPSPASSLTHTPRRRRRIPSSSRPNRPPLPLLLPLRQQQPRLTPPQVKPQQLLRLPVDAPVGRGKHPAEEGGGVGEAAEEVELFGGVEEGLVFGFGEGGGVGVFWGCWSCWGCCWGGGGGRGGGEEGEGGCFVDLGLGLLVLVRLFVHSFIIGGVKRGGGCG